MSGPSASPSRCCVSTIRTCARSSTSTPLTTSTRRAGSPLLTRVDALFPALIAFESAPILGRVCHVSASASASAACGAIGPEDRRLVYQPVPSSVDFPALEREVLDFWKRTRAFEKLVERNASGPRWSFIDGPITANNPMGVHHAWGRTYKDVFQRYYAMLGYQQRYQNGFDCQGLWVEVEVEKELGLKSKRDIEAFGIAEFVERCKQRVMKYAGRI